MGNRLVQHRHRVACLTLAGLMVIFAAAAPTSAVPRAPDPIDETGSVVVAFGTKAAHSEFLPDAEATLLSLLNQCRAAHHLGPLAMSGALRNTARGHSRDMAMEGFAGHGSLLGPSFLDRLSPVVSPGTFVGENVTVAQTVEQANRAFMASPGHLKNMLDPRFRNAGIGVATADSLGLAVTEDFAQ